MAVSIRFRPDGRSVLVERGTTLLDAVRSAGLPMASACGAEGLCGRCGVRVLSGGESLTAENAWERRVKERNRIDPDLRLACRVAAQGDVEITTSYW